MSEPRSGNPYFIRDSPMLNLLAQSQPVDPREILGVSITGEMMVVCVVLIAASVAIWLGICFLVTQAVVAIRVASIQAKLTEKLVREGLPEAQIKRLLQANRAGLKGSIFGLQSSWRKPEPASASVLGKPETI